MPHKYKTHEREKSQPVTTQKMKNRPPIRFESAVEEHEKPQSLATTDSNSMIDVMKHRLKLKRMVEKGEVVRMRAKELESQVEARDLLIQELHERVAEAESEARVGTAKGKIEAKHKDLRVSVFPQRKLFKRRTRTI